MQDSDRGGPTCPSQLIFSLCQKSPGFSPEYLPLCGPPVVHLGRYLYSLHKAEATCTYIYNSHRAEERSDIGGDRALEFNEMGGDHPRGQYNDQNRRTPEMYVCERAAKETRQRRAKKRHQLADTQIQTRTGGRPPPGELADNGLKINI